MGQLSSHKTPGPIKLAGQQAGGISVGDAICCGFSSQLWNHNSSTPANMLNRRALAGQVRCRTTISKVAEYSRAATEGAGTRTDTREAALPIFFGPPGGEGAANCSQASAAFDIAWLFVKLPSAHFPLQATSFNEFAEAADCLLNRFAVAKTHDNH